MRRLFILLLIAVLTFAAGLVAAKIPSVLGPVRQIPVVAGVPNPPMVEAEWIYIPGFCTCGPDYPGEVSHRTGKWERTSEDGKRAAVYVDYYRIDSARGAAKIMTDVGRGKRANGASCRVGKYQLADEAYLVNCVNDSNGTVGGRESITYRKGSNIVVLWGRNTTLLKRFAGESLTLIPNN